MATMKKSCKETIKQYWLNDGGKAIPYGMGCAWLGRGSLDKQSIQKDVAVLDLAYQSGFRYFDTSAAYGDSEVIVGEFVSHTPRETLFLASKTRIPERIPPKLAGEYARINLEASLSRLNTDYLDLYQLHDLNGLSQVMVEGGVLDALLQAQKQGLIRYIGMATRDHSILETTINHGSFDSILTYSDYTPIDQTATQIMHAAAERNVAAINASPLSAGLLTGKNLREFPVPQDPEMRQRTQKAIELYDLCARYDTSVLDFALQFPLASEMDITLTGSSSTQDTQDTLHALRTDLPSELWEAWKERNNGNG